MEPRLPPTLKTESNTPEEPELEDTLAPLDVSSDRRNLWPKIVDAAQVISSLASALALAKQEQSTTPPPIPPTPTPPFPTDELMPFPPFPLDPSTGLIFGEVDDQIAICYGGISASFEGETSPLVGQVSTKTSESFSFLLPFGKL